MTWYTIFDYTPPASTTDGGVGSVGGGWTDPGAKWSRSQYSNIYISDTNAGNGGSPWNNRQLVRKAASEASINQKIQLRFITYGPANVWMLARYSAPNGDATGNGYAITNGQIVPLINGSLGTFQNGNTGSGVQNATEYDMEVSVVQTNATTTTITQTTWLAPSGAAFGSGNQVSTNTYTDTTSALQNLSGGQGFFIYMGAGQSAFVDHFTSYSDVSPTGMNLTPSSANVQVGTASAFTVNYSGTLSSATTVTLSDGGGGGTFSPTSLTLSASTNPSATFTYTPGSAGSKTLTATPNNYAPLSATVTAYVQGATLTMSHPSTVISPYTWTTGLSGDVVRTWHTGAYARFYVSGSTSGTINIGPCGGTVYVSMQIDDNAWGVGFGVSTNSTISVTLPDGGVHSIGIMLIAIGQTAGRWDGSNCLTINSYVCGAGGAGAPATRGSRNILFYGTSIWEGIQADNGNDNFLYDTVFFVGEAYRRLGYEYGNVSCGSSGYSTPVVSSNGGTPAAFVPGNDAASAWNKLDGAGGKRTTGTGAAERFVPQPDVILDEWGTNDGLQSIASNTIQAAVSGFYAALRSAAPNALLLKVIPYGGYKRADILAALASLPADNKRQVIDLAIDQRQSDYGGVHPGRTGHAQIATMLIPKISAALTPPSLTVRYRR